MIRKNKRKKKNMKKFFIFTILFKNTFYSSNSEPKANILYSLKKRKTEEYRERHNLKIIIIKEITDTTKALEAPILVGLLKKSSKKNN